MSEVPAHRKTPWNTRMDPDEFGAYYEHKIAELHHECELDGCTETTAYPRRYCGHVCENRALQAAAEIVAARIEERGAR